MSLPAVLVRYRDEWQYDGMGFAVALAALDRYRRDGTDLFQISSLAEQF